MGGIGSFVVAFVLLVEHVGRKVCFGFYQYVSRPNFVQFTTLVGIAIEIPFALGEAFLGLEAFFIRYVADHKVITDYSFSIFTKNSEVSSFTF